MLVKVAPDNKQPYCSWTGKVNTTTHFYHYDYFVGYFSYMAHIFFFSHFHKRALNHTKWQTQKGSGFPRKILLHAVSIPSGVSCIVYLFNCTGLLGVSSIYQRYDNIWKTGALWEIIDRQLDCFMELRIFKYASHVRQMHLQKRWCVVVNTNRWWKRLLNHVFIWAKQLYYTANLCADISNICWHVPFLAWYLLICLALCLIAWLVHNKIYASMWNVSFGLAIWWWMCWMQYSSYIKWVDCINHPYFIGWSCCRN